MTTRGFMEQECTDLANWMCDVIDSRGDETVMNNVKEKVLAVCQRLPVYS